MNISYSPVLLLHLIASGFPDSPSSHRLDSLQQQKRDKAGAGNIAFNSTDGGQQDRTLAKGSLINWRKVVSVCRGRLELVRCFIGQAPGQTQSIFGAPALKGYEK
jgi:hypothetical protein